MKWPSKGVSTRVTGFAHIDGAPGATWPPPRPRGVGWAFVLLLLLTGAALAAIVALAGLVIGCVMLVERDADWAGFGAAHEGVLTGLLLAGVSAIMASAFFLQSWFRDRRPPAALGLSRPRWAVFAMWWGGAVVLVAPLLAIACAEQNVWSLLPASLLAAAGAAPFFFIQSSAEEIMFRGWLLQTISARHGALIGLIASSLLFALLHLDPIETPLGMVVGVLARVPLGMALGLLALRYSNLWAGFGLHAGWNAAMFCSAALQTARSGVSPWQALLSSNSHTVLRDLIEPGFLATIAIMLIGLAIVWFTSGDVRDRLLAKAQT